MINCKAEMRKGGYLLESTSDEEEWSGRKDLKLSRASGPRKRRRREVTAPLRAVLTDTRIPLVLPCLRYLCRCSRFDAGTDSADHHDHRYERGTECGDGDADGRGSD